MITEIEESTAVTAYWNDKVALLEFAFQPIVNIHSGTIFGYESLLRNISLAGFDSIDEVFNRACDQKAIYYLDLLLRKKAIAKFASFRKPNEKLFYNLDSRVIEMPDYSTGNTDSILREFGMSPSCLVFELSEKYEFKSYHLTKSILDIYKSQKYNIAIDDYGTGYSGLQLLYHSEPDIIKLDKFFISNIHKDIKKKLFVVNITEIAHTMGIRVVAEGIEKEEELVAVKEAGCDYIQGFYIEHPLMFPEKNRTRYHLTQNLPVKEKSDRELIDEQMDYIIPVYTGSSMETVYNLFKTYKNHTIFPLLNENNEPLGIIREKDIKNYLYTNYGKELILRFPLEDFIAKIAVQEITTPASLLVRIYSMNHNSDGILITENGQYSGFLSARSLLKVIDEKKQEKSKNLNPLSKFPSATRVNQFIATELLNLSNDSSFIFIDILHFSEFNELSSYKKGDAVISLLAELIRQEDAFGEGLTGHFGGDNFFIGTGNLTAKIEAALENLLKKFNALSGFLYNDTNTMLFRDKNNQYRQHTPIELKIAVIEIDASEKANTALENILQLQKELIENNPAKDLKIIKKIFRQTPAAGELGA